MNGIKLNLICIVRIRLNRVILPTGRTGRNSRQERWALRIELRANEITNEWSYHIRLLRAFVRENNNLCREQFRPSLMTLCRRPKSFQQIYIFGKSFLYKQFLRKYRISIKWLRKCLDSLWFVSKFIKTIIGAFFKLRKANIIFVISVCLSVFAHGTTQLLLHGNFCLKIFRKICPENSNFIHVWHE
jgi:hypothetical protein